MASPSPVLLLCLVLLLALPAIRGLEYRVTNNAKETRGGDLFDRIMGEKRATSSMQAASFFIWHRVFCQEKISDRKQVERISLIIEPTLNQAAQYQEHVENQYSYEIKLNAQIVIESIVPESFSFDKQVNNIAIEDRVIFEINWRLTLGIAYALQWTANGAIPQALRNGIAAFAVLEAHHKPAGWVEAGEGDPWDKNPDVTAQFLYYISKKKNQFVAKLNEMMKTSYDEKFFQEAAGMTMDECWEKYKRVYHRE